MQRPLTAAASRDSRATARNPVQSRAFPSNPAYSERFCRLTVVVSGARKPSQFPVPEGCDPSDWRDLLANRKSKRLGMTPSIYRKLLRDLAEQTDDDWPPGRILRHAAEKGWAAIFDPRNDGLRHHDRTPAKQSGWLNA